MNFHTKLPVYLKATAKLMRDPVNNPHIPPINTFI